MYKLEKKYSTTHDRFLNPSFSSTLLDQIYRSIDEGERKFSYETTTFYTEQKPTVTNKKTDKKHNNNNNNYNIKQRIEKLDSVVKENDNKKSNKNRAFSSDSEDVLFFSSTSISSDSSYGGFSSSDTESLYGTKSRATTCFIPPKPKPVKTTASFRFENEKQRNRVFDGFCKNSQTKQSIKNHGKEEEEEKARLIKSNSRAVKIYNNLKKVKQPISPGGKLTSFLNSLFSNNNNENKKKKKIKIKSTYCEDERKIASTCCSSGSSFSRSCLSKTTSFNDYGVNNNKTVRFCDVEEATKKFMNEYHYNHKKKKEKNDLVLLKDLCINQKDELLEDNYDDDYDDDVASYASSDLFELDHLSVLGDSSRYCEELPVFGTTRVS